MCFIVSFSLNLHCCFLKTKYLFGTTPLGVRFPSPRRAFSTCVAQCLSSTRRPCIVLPALLLCSIVAHRRGALAHAELADFAGLRPTELPSYHRALQLVGPGVGDLSVRHPCCCSSSDTASLRLLPVIYAERVVAVSLHVALREWHVLRLALRLMLQVVQPLPPLVSTTCSHRYAVQLAHTTNRASCARAGLSPRASRAPLQPARFKTPPFVW